MSQERKQFLHRVCIDIEIAGEGADDGILQETSVSHMPRTKKERWSWEWNFYCSVTSNAYLDNSTKATALLFIIGIVSEIILSFLFLFESRDIRKSLGFVLGPLLHYPLFLRGSVLDCLLLDFVHLLGRV
ncbi:MAG: hypothetical protein NVSMB49_06130 [Ktedonobacteraceae bacterium]